MVAVVVRCCHGPSTAWPTFARRERRKKSATPVGMTEFRNWGEGIIGGHRERWGGGG